LSVESFLPRTFYTYDVELQKVLDLRRRKARDAVGLRDADLSADDLRACQAVGEAAHVCGREAILAPGATGRGEVLAVFTARLLPASTVRERDAELWESVPAID